MKFEKKHAWLLIGVGIWNFWVWGTFIRTSPPRTPTASSTPTATTSRTRC